MSNEIIKPAGASLLEELIFPHSPCVTVFCDNYVAMFLIQIFAIPHSQSRLLIFEK